MGRVNGIRTDDAIVVPGEDLGDRDLDPSCAEVEVLSEDDWTPIVSFGDSRRHTHTTHMGTRFDRLSVG